MNRYKSWATLNKQLQDLLCAGLKGRVTYFLTRYHKVHNAYGRAAIRVDDQNLSAFHGSKGTDRIPTSTSCGMRQGNGIVTTRKWGFQATCHEMDFLAVATAFLEMPVSQTLHSENCILRIFAILDRRVGKRTLRRIREQGAYQKLPPWVQQFYQLRLGMC